MSVRKRYVRPETVESRMSVAVTQHNTRNTEALLAEGADPNLRYDAYPVLFSATLPNLRVLHAHGADLNIKNDLGYTLLNYLCNRHRLQPSSLNETGRIRFLLENGAEPNLPDSDGSDTPLHNICRGSTDPAIIRLLLQYEADPNYLNDEGETPLHCLAGNISIFMGRPIRPYRESVEALLAGGANPNIRDESGHLPSEHARAVFTEPALRYIGPLEQEFVTYLEHIEQGIPPPPPGAPAVAAPAPAAHMNVYDPFNNGNNMYHPPPPPPPVPHVIRNRPNQPNRAVPVGNNQNNRNQYPAEANENRFGGGRSRRRGRTVKRGKGSKGKGKGRRHNVRTRRH